MTRLALHDLTVGYGRRPAAHHVTGALAAGDGLAVMGPNGAGKSTLLAAIAGRLRPLSGRIETQGAVGYLPQSPRLNLRIPLRAFDFAAMGAAARTGPYGGLSRADRDRVGEALATVGLTDLADRPVAAMSGGQRQRLLFARLMVQDAAVLLLDEPFAAIDADTTADLLAVIAGWRAQGRIVAAALHDLDTARAGFPLTLLLARDAIAWGPTAEVLTPDRLARARAMHQGWADAAPVCDRGHAA
jgi:zinc/manganese transport system ATP-binding protein